MLNPDIAAQQAYYDERWAQTTYANRLQLRRAVAILDALETTGLRSPKILDLGCGTGWLTGILGRFGPTTGVELSPAAVALASRRHPDVEFVAADISSMRGTAQFDVVVSQEVIEHVENHSAHIDLAAESLRPGGYLILTTPNAVNFSRWTRGDLERWGLQPIERWLTVRQLRALLTPRFRIRQIRTIIGGYGSHGVFRVLNAPTFTNALSAVGLLRGYHAALARLGLGLHIVVLAERRSRDRQ